MLDSINKFIVGKWFWVVNNCLVWKEVSRKIITTLFYFVKFVVFSSNWNGGSLMGLDEKSDVSIKLLVSAINQPSGDGTCWPRLSCQISNCYFHLSARHKRFRLHHKSPQEWLSWYSCPTSWTMCKINADQRGWQPYGAQLLAQLRLS